MTNDSNNRNHFSVFGMLKWIGGIILAAILTIGSAGFIMHRNGPVDMNNLHGFQYWLTLFITPPVALCLFVFLSCAFVPFYKKYAALLVMSLCTFFIGYGTYGHYTYDGFVADQYKLIYSGFIIGLIAGFIVGYSVFSEIKWTSV